MMGFASTSVVSGHCEKGSSCPSVRSHLTAAGAFASAGIVAVGLVAAPPDIGGARTEVRAVRLAAVALPPAAQWAALERFIGNQAQTVVPVTKAVAGGAADITTAVGATARAQTVRATAEPAIEPAISSPVLNNTALASTTTTGLSIPAPIAPIVGFFGALLLFAPAAILVILACPPCALFNVVTGLIKSILVDLRWAIAPPSTAIAEVNPTIGPALESVPVLSSSAPAITTTPESNGAAPAADARKVDVSPPVKSTDAATRTEQVSTDTAKPTNGVTEVAEADEVLTGPAASSVPEPSAAASKPAKPTVRSATPRPVVRESLGVGKKLRDLAHRGTGGHSTTRTGAAADKSGTGESPAAASSSARGDDSSGGDAGDS